MAWWRSFFTSKEEVPAIKPEAENASEEIGGLNFKTAIEAHIKWKQRLKGVIDGTGMEVLDPRVVSSDNQCALGKWIYTDGQSQYGSHPEFKAVVSAHAHFHKCAGRTLELALDGKFAEADGELTNGDFARSSHEVTRHLMRLWRDIGIEK